jgi:hypothetical protein
VAQGWSETQTFVVLAVVGVLGAIFVPGLWVRMRVKRRDQ